MSTDIDECISHGFALCSEFNTQCLNLQGTFSCVCSTGFYWSDAGNVCVDVDECTLGAHDCGPMYQCKNTQGSFRCVPKRCEDDQVLDPGTGECKSVNCPPGYKPRDGRCEDIDECREKINACPVYEECVNTPGSFRCQEQGNVCSNGYYMDRESGFCLDIDECQRGTHTCSSTDDCINLPGIFRCKCSPGFEFNEFTMRCEDIDECIKFSGHACSLQADCVNSIGSYQCICKPGFSLASDNRSCDDINECALGIAKCQQKCINSPGSYQCICDRGNELCMGKCVNTPGSFLCTCPEGYQVMSDGITCKGMEYIRCLKRPGFCENLSLERCKKWPIHISWQHIAIPKQVNISLHRTSVTLFSMKGPPNPNSSMQFELRLVSVKQGEDHNSAIIALRDSLDGPQEVHLELTLRLTTNGLFNGKYVANLLVFVSQYRPQTQHSRLHRIRRI
uniref:Fibulin-1 n=1 Tax=Meloidogyne hapla TaxID=6305 RepID=A0A1I8B392_MELHA